MGFSTDYRSGMRLRSGSARLAAALVLAAVAIAPHGVLAQAAQTTGVGSQFELTFWQSVESGSDPALYEAYLAQYPNGTFAALARVKLTKLRQASAASPATAQPPLVQAPLVQAAPVQPAAVQPAPVQAQPAPALAPPPPVPVVTAQAPAPALPPPPVKPASKLATAAPIATPPGTPATRERRAGPAPVSRASAVPPSAGDGESTPYITPAPPVEPAGESEDSAALRRLLGALGDSQRAGAPPPAPIVDVAEPAASTAQLAPAPATVAVPVTAPSASPPRLVQTAMPAQQPALGPPIAVADAVALSATSTVSADPHPIAVGPLPAGFALPPRPQLSAIPPLAFPVSFCSAEARNAFHDGPYIAAVEAAKRNNDAAIAYLRLLQDLYDTNQLSGDINPVNAIAAESRAYGPVAAAAFSAQSTLVGAFSTLMAVPILACDAPRQP